MIVLKNSSLLYERWGADALLDFFVCFGLVYFILFIVEVFHLHVCICTMGVPGALEVR